MIATGATGASTVNTGPPLLVPFGVVTDTVPVVAPVGTVAWMVVSFNTVKVAGVPLKLTADVPRNPLPLIVTEAPTDALTGVNPVTVGTAGGGGGAR